MPTDWDAIVLAGGAGRRMDGVSKSGLEVGGTSLLGRVVRALVDARRVIVVGPRVGTASVDVWAREDPPGGGPVAGLAAAVSEVHAPFVAVVAGDLPFLTPAAMSQLRSAADPLTVAIALDDRGRDQFLLALWPAGMLRRALASAGPAHGLALRAVYRGAVYRGAAVRRVSFDGFPPPWWDCDTPEQLAQARAWSGVATGTGAAHAEMDVDDDVDHDVDRGIEAAGPVAASAPSRRRGE